MRQVGLVMANRLSPELSLELLQTPGQAVELALRPDWDANYAHESTLELVKFVELAQGSIADWKWALGGEMELALESSKASG